MFIFWLKHFILFLSRFWFFFLFCVNAHWTVKHMGLHNWIPSFLLSCILLFFYYALHAQIMQIFRACGLCSVNALITRWVASSDCLFSNISSSAAGLSGTINDVVSQLIIWLLVAALVRATVYLTPRSCSPLRAGRSTCVWAEIGIKPLIKTHAIGVKSHIKYSMHIWVFYFVN